MLRPSQRRLCVLVDLDSSEFCRMCLLSYLLPLSSCDILLVHSKSESFLRSMNTCSFRLVLCPWRHLHPVSSLSPGNVLPESRPQDPKFRGVTRTLVNTLCFMFSLLHQIVSSTKVPFLPFSVHLRVYQRRLRGAHTHSPILSVCKIIPAQQNAVGDGPQIGSCPVPQKCLTSFKKLPARPYPLEAHSSLKRLTEWGVTPSRQIHHTHLAEHLDVERFGEDLYRVQGRHAMKVAAVDVHLYYLLGIVYLVHADADTERGRMLVGQTQTRTAVGGTRRRGKRCVSQRIRSRFHQTCSQTETRKIGRDSSGTNPLSVTQTLQYWQKHNERTWYAGGCWLNVVRRPPSARCDLAPTASRSDL